MALRVLLADESTTIKKVMQLALQDFAVDVKAVQSGLDVAEVARAFKPDIIFVDVLLPKKNGYDVGLELKSDKSLNSLPVVLMWSSFMDLDESQFIKSNADGKLEKPFDVETLRSLVKELVPKTQTQRLAHFLQFPADFVEPMVKEEKQKQNPVAADPMGAVIPQPDPQARKPSTTPAPSPMAKASITTQAPSPALSMQPEPTPASSSWSMDNFEPLPDVMSHFDSEVDDEPMKITKLGGTKTSVQAPMPTADESSGDPWAHQDLARFKLDIPEQDVEGEEISLVFDVNEPEPQGDDFLLKRTSEVTKATARIQMPKLEKPEITQPQVDTSGFSLENTRGGEKTAYQYQPIGEVADVDGGMISQFADQIPNEHISELALEEPPAAFEMTPPISANSPIEYPMVTMSHSVNQSVPQMDADQLERVIRAQSKEVIEAVVARVVPEIAREMIKKELDRLLSES